MEIQKFLEETSKGIIPLAELTTLAADRRCFGDDVLSAFTSQVQQRSTQAQTVLDAATAANRDTLLASEQRSYDAAIRERDSLLSLQRAIEARTEQRAFVPHTQTPIETADADRSLVLTRSDKLTSRISRPAGITDRSFGRVVASRLFGRVNGIELTQAERRALEEGTDSAGGFTVPEVLAASFIDRVRDALVVQRAGAVIVPMTSDTLNMARLATGGIGSPNVPPSAAWKVENDPVAEASLTLERVQFRAHTLTGLIKMSVELSEDSTNIDQIIERELSASMALELDRVALAGSGSDPEPEGLINVSGVDLDTAATLDYDLLIDMIAAVQGRNFQPSGRIYDASAAATLAKLRGGPGSDYLTVPPMVATVPAYLTNAVGTTGSPPAYVLYVGAFENLMIGMRTSFRLESTRVGSGAFESLQVAVRAYLRADVQLAHPEAFCIRTLDGGSPA